jgi:integrase
MRKHLVPMNVCELGSAPREADHEIHPLDEAQANAFLIAARGERMETLFILALRTGMRQGELLALKWADVNLDRGSLLVRASLRALRGRGYAFNPPKTKAGRRTITPAIIDTLKARLLPPALLRVEERSACLKSAHCPVADLAIQQDPGHGSIVVYRRLSASIGIVVKIVVRVTSGIFCTLRES